MAVSYRSEALKRLKSEKYWVVRERGKDLELARVINGRAIIVRLSYQSNRKYRIIFPSYIFESKISHWGPNGDEVRMCRNKSLLKSLVKVLKRSAAWDLIDNRDFIAINVSNVKSDKRKVSNELKDLYSVSK